jgi:hypothetical protein
MHSTTSLSTTYIYLNIYWTLSYVAFRRAAICTACMLTLINSDTITPN